MRFTRSHITLRRPIPALAGLTAVAVAAAFVPAALGAAPVPKTPQERVMVDYSKCMRAKGISTFPDPVRGSNGKLAFPKLSASFLAQAKVKAAGSSCAASLRRGFAGGNPSFRDSAAFQKFTACLKQNGVTLPQRPTGTRPARTNPPKAGASGSRPAGQRGGFFRNASPAAQKAFAKCRALLPARPAGAGQTQSG